MPRALLLVALCGPIVHADPSSIGPLTLRLAAELERIPILRDVQIPQAFDYPTLDVNIDRVRAGQLGSPRIR